MWIRSKVVIVGLVVATCVMWRGEASGQVEAITSCESVGSATPICGFTNPEDLVALPGGEAILVSEFGAMEGDTPGGLALLVLDTERRRELFRGGDADGTAPVWGDLACPGPPPPLFSPHGIHLSERADGALQLLAVQHGGRESIEFFEVTGSGRNWSVTWRGCCRGPRRRLAQRGGGAAGWRLRDHQNDGEPMAAHMDITLAARRRAASDGARLDAAGSSVLFCCATPRPDGVRRSCAASPWRHGHLVAGEGTGFPGWSVR